MKELGITGKFFKRMVAAFLLLCLFSFPLAAQVSETKKNRSDEGVDYAAARKDILQFEAALDNVIDTFSKGPLGVWYHTKGAYLEGFGLTFSFLINMNQAMVPTPFGIVKRHSATAEQKEQRIEELKEMLIHVLQDSGKKFQQLRKEDCVTIIAFIDDKTFQNPMASKTIVLRAVKKDLDELGGKRDRYSEFKKRIKIVEY
jgi:hypothetical protein